MDRRKIKIIKIIVITLLSFLAALFWFEEISGRGAGSPAVRHFFPRLLAKESATAVVVKDKIPDDSVFGNQGGGRLYY